MDTEALLERFGYLAVFLGTFLEGEATVIMAGFFAARGHMDVLKVGAVVFAGAYASHLFWFWLGRVYGVKLLDRFPKMRKHFGSGIRMFERYGAGAIVVTQWIYGLRITCAVIVGISNLSIIKFLLYEAFSCLLWATTITSIGYYFGAAVERLLGRTEHAGKWGLLVIILIAVGVWWWHRRKEKRDEAVVAP